MTGTRELVALALLAPAALCAQGTMADYQRAQALQKRYTPLVYDSPDAPVWIEGTSKFWYRKTVKGGTAAVVVDAATLEKRPATASDTMSAGGGRAGRGGGGGGGGRGGANAAEATRTSPDGKLLAYIDNFNIAVKPVGGTEGARISACLAGCTLPSKKYGSRSASVVRGGTR